MMSQNKKEAETYRSASFHAGCGIRNHVGLPPNGFQVFSGASRIVSDRPRNAPIFGKIEPFSAR